MKGRDKWGDTDIDVGMVWKYWSQDMTRNVYWIQVTVQERLVTLVNMIMDLAVSYNADYNFTGWATIIFKKNVSVAYLFVCCIFIYPVPIMFSELNDRNW